MVKVTLRKKIFTTVEGATGVAVIKSNSVDVELGGQHQEVAIKDANNLFEIDSILTRQFGMKVCTQESCEFVGKGYRGILKGIAPSKGASVTDSKVCYLDAHSDDNVTLVSNMAISSPIHHYNASLQKAEKCCEAAKNSINVA